MAEIPTINIPGRPRFTALIGGPLLPCALFVLALIVAIWLPVVVAAQQPHADSWRFDAYEKSLREMDDRLRTTEEKMPALAQVVQGIDEAVKRDDARLGVLEHLADEVRRVSAVLDFIRWEATICAGGFGAFMLWIVNWIVKSFRQVRRDLIETRRDARQSRNDDIQMIGIPLLELIEKDHPEIARAIYERIRQRQAHEDKRDEESSYDGIPLFRFGKSE